MVNHVKTLLMNRSAAELSRSSGVPWMVDQSFTPVVLDQNMLSFRNSVFTGVPDYDIVGQANRVDVVLGLVLTPENHMLSEFLDTRVTDVVRPPSSVFEFYASMNSNPDKCDFVGSVLGNGAVSSLFSVSDSVPGDMPALIGLYRSRWESSPEITVKFSSAVSAYVLRLEALRLRSVGKGL